VDDLMGKGWLSFGVVGLLLFPVSALPERQIITKLNEIPVFTILNQQGSPLVGRVKGQDGQDKGIVPFFLDPKQAQIYYDDYQKKAPPDVKTKFRLVVITLGEAVVAARDEAKNKDSKLRYVFQPAVEAQQVALTLLKKTAPKLKQYPGTPVFFVGKSETEPTFFNRGLYLQGKDGNPVVSPKGTEPLIPFFFNARDAEDLLQLVKKNKPKDNTTLHVLGLFQVLDLMADDKNNELTQAISFSPDDAALQFVTTLQKTTPPDFLKPKAPSLPEPTPEPAPAPPFPTP
jgi:Tic22-like family